jgi:hypothetical protein
MERLKVAPISEEKASSSHSSSSLSVLPPLSPSLSSSEKEKFSLPRPLIKTEVLAPMSIPHQPTFRKIHFQPMLFKGDSTDNLSDYKVNVDTFLNFASFASEEEKLSIVLSKFSPFALSWFDHLLVKPQTVGNLLKRVLSDFGQQVQESAYSRLASRKQQKGESVHVFYEAMSTLIGQVPGHLSEEQRLFYFVEGLLPGIKSELQKLKNLLSETGVVFDLPMAKRTAQKIEFDNRSKEIIDISQVSESKSGDDELTVRIAAILQRQFQNPQSSQFQNQMGKSERKTPYFKGVCRKCDKYGHLSENCRSHIICENCKKNGHETKDCYIGQNRHPHKKWVNSKNNQGQGNV